MWNKGGGELYKKINIGGLMKEKDKEILIRIARIVIKIIKEVNKKNRKKGVM